MQQESPVTIAGRKAAEELNEFHYKKVNELLLKHGLITEGEKLDEKSLEAKGYLINQIMLPGNQYRLQLAKIEDVVQYKAEVKFDLEVNDMADTTLEDTEERRAARREDAKKDSEAPAPAPAEESDTKKTDE